MMGFHKWRLKQQFLNFSDQLMLHRTFIQSSGLHLFPTCKLGIALPLVRFFLFYIKQVLFRASKQLQYSLAFVLLLIQTKTGTCLFLYAKWVLHLTDWRWFCVCLSCTHGERWFCFSTHTAFDLRNISDKYLLEIGTCKPLIWWIIIL